MKKKWQKGTKRKWQKDRSLDMGMRKSILHNIIWKIYMLQNAGS
jgi:hypothetical protein